MTSGLSRIVDVMKWEAMLEGDEFDLQALPDHFDTDPQVRGDGGLYWLSTSTFDSQHEAALVQEAARAVVARINGAMRLLDNGFQSVSLSGRYRNENGDHVVLGIASAVLRLRTGVVGITGGTHGPRPIGPREYAQLGTTDIAAADVLLVLGRGDLDWYDLWKVFEIVREDIGGEAAIIRKGLATKSVVSAFRVSANHPGVSGEAARHARMPGVPKRTMAIGQGRTFISDLARSWMKSRLASTGNVPPRPSGS
jgi:hypothetical protein